MCNCETVKRRSVESFHARYGAMHFVVIFIFSHWEGRNTCVFLWLSVCVCVYVALVVCSEDRKENILKNILEILLQNFAIKCMNHFKEFCLLFIISNCVEGDAIVVLWRTFCQLLIVLSCICVCVPVCVCIVLCDRLYVSLVNNNIVRASS